MGRRGRKDINKHARDFVSENLVHTVEQMMENRHRLLLPFPIGTDELFVHFWTPEEFKALGVLALRQKLFWKSGVVEMSAVIHYMGKPRAVKIEINLPEAQPCAEHPLPVDQLPPEDAEKVREWALAWIEMRVDKTRLSSRIKQVARACKTYGQVVRLWPDLEGFFPAFGREKVANAKVQSKLPDDCYEWHETAADEFEATDLIPDFRPENLAPFAEMIAECLLLPNVPGEHQASVTLV